MRTRAEVNKLSLLVEADVLALVSVLLGKLNLVRLVHLCKLSDCLIGSKLETADFKTGLDNLLHFSLDLFQILCREGLLDIKVIVESAVDSGTDRAFCIGVKSFYRLCKNV